MFCKNCGSENLSDAKFCAGCGAEIDTANNTSSASGANDTPTVTFGIDCFMETLKERYAKFDGRATRTEFWCFQLFGFLAELVAIVLVGVLASAGGDKDGVGVGGVIALVVILALVIPYISVTIRRLHDTGRSGWWSLINLVPYIGFVIVFVLCALESEPNTNRYGKCSK